MALNALIVGAGSGTSASFARILARQGARVALAARNIDKLVALNREIDGLVIGCDATDVDQVANLFEQLDKTMGAPDVVLYNASAYTSGPVAELDPQAVLHSLILRCRPATQRSLRVPMRCRSRQQDCGRKTPRGARRQFPTGTASQST